MKKQGYIRSIPITEAKEGMQVLFENQIRTIKTVYNGIVEFVNTHGPQAYDYELSQLVVEYEEITGQWKEQAKLVKVIQIPLKYSQWQKAIENGEVDSDKEVTFEILGKILEPHKDFYGDIRYNASMQYAKIIPSKEEKKLYTEEDMRKAYYQGRLDEIDVYQFKPDGKKICEKVHPDPTFKKWLSQYKS